eukprot:08099.XXX_238698_238955_1 [CDS] Oithona nana genome sequencing.
MHVVHMLFHVLHHGKLLVTSWRQARNCLFGFVGHMDVLIMNHSSLLLGENLEAKTTSVATISGIEQSWIFIFDQSFWCFWRIDRY